MALDSVDKILDFAITQEEKAAAFYTDLANRMSPKHMKEVFLGFAREEEGHKAKLLAIKSGKRLAPVEQRVLDLKIGDHLTDTEISSDLNYQDALILAMKAEKVAFRLYTDLASVATDAALRESLLGLAQEEAKHKLRFEIEYDDNVLTEN